MPLTATGVGGPQWRTKRTINHHVAVVLDYKESSGSPSARPPHWTSGVIDHEVAVSLHHSETGIRALSSTVPERIPPLIQHQVSVNLQLHVRYGTAHHHTTEAECRSRNYGRHVRFSEKNGQLGAIAAGLTSLESEISSRRFRGLPGIWRARAP